MSDTKQQKVIASLSVTPLGVGTSVSKYVKHAVKALKQVPEIRVQHTPMATIIEADSIESVFLATKLVNEDMFSQGAERVSINLRIDDRRDKPRMMEDKVDAIT